MKVNYKTIKKDNRDNEYKLMYSDKGLPDMEFCCEDMIEAWGDYIGFGEYEYGESNNKDVNIYYCEPYPEGACWSEMPIKICPFCGERIELIEEKVVKKVLRVSKKMVRVEEYDEVVVK